MEIVPNISPLIDETRKKNQSLESTPLDSRGKLITKNRDVYFNEKKRTVVGEASEYLKEY